MAERWFAAMRSHLPASSSYPTETPLDDPENGFIGCLKIYDLTIDGDGAFAARQNDGAHPPLSYPNVIAGDRASPVAIKGEKLCAGSVDQFPRQRFPPTNQV